MSIPYIRQINYLSPSSFQEFIEDPVLFFLKRLGPLDYAPAAEPEGYPAAVGTAFDAVIKVTIAGIRRLKCPSLKTLLDNVHTERPKAIAMGHELAANYAYCGALRALLSESPVEVEGRTVNPILIPGTEVPILGHLDCVLAPDVVCDWKTYGANKPGEYSPNPGYNRLFTTAEPGTDQGSHKRAGEPLESLNEKWAVQTSMYGWIRGKPIGRHRVAIDQLIIGKDGALRVAQYRTFVSAGFQRRLRDQLVAAWDAIQNEKVVPEDLAEAGLDFVAAIK